MSLFRLCKAVWVLAGLSLTVFPLLQMVLRASHRLWCSSTETMSHVLWIQNIFLLFILHECITLPEVSGASIKCKSWLSPLELSEYTLLSVTENTLSAKDIRKALWDSLSEYLGKKRMFFTAYLNTSTGEGKGLSEQLCQCVNVNLPNVLCRAPLSQY